MPLVMSGLLTGALQVWIDLPYLAFVSIVPLISAVYNFQSIKDFYCKMIAFLLPYYFIQSLFLITVYELIHIPVIAGLIVSVLLTVAVTLWLTILMLLPLSIYPFVRKEKDIDLLLFSFLFILGEFVAEYVPFLSFPWSGLWLSVISEPMLSQPAALLGCRFVSFLILVENCFVLMIFLNKTLRGMLKKAAFFAFILLSITAYSTAHISKLKADVRNSESIKVMAAQDNIEGRAKEKVNLSGAVDSYISIMEQNWQDNIKLVVLPETAVPASYDEKSEEFQKLCEFAKNKRTTILTGCFVTIDQNRYNAMYSVTPDGFCKSPYLKQVLIPFGEKIPLAALWGINTITCGDKSDSHCLSTSDGIKTASVICVESIYPSLTRCRIKEGGEILCISTNDSWFGESYARSAHYRHSVMRAVESGKYTVRAGNCGISAIITPWGETTVSEERPVKTAVTTDVRLIENKNIYTTLGDIIVIPGVILTIFGIFKALKKLKVKFKKPC